MAFLPICAAAQTLPLALTITDTRLNDDEVAITLDAEVTQSTAFSATTVVFAYPAADLKPNTTPVVTYEGEANFGTMQQNIMQNMVDGEITVTLSRNNGTNTAASGKLVRLQFVVIDNIMGKNAQKRDWSQVFTLKTQDFVNQSFPSIIIHDGSMNIISDTMVLRNVFIYDMVGKLLFTQTLTDTNRVPLSAIASGIYMVEIVTDKGVFIKKCFIGN